MFTILLNVPHLPDYKAIRKLIMKHRDDKGFNARDSGLIAGASLAHWGPIDLSLIYAGLNPESEFFLQDNGEPYKNVYRTRKGKKIWLIHTK